MVANSTTSENMAWYRVDAQRQPHKDGRAKVHDNQDSLSQGHYSECKHKAPYFTIFRTRGDGDAAVQPTGESMTAL